jgi:DNA replication and repair protein RecF
MMINSIRINNFRNYENIKLVIPNAPSPVIVVLYGNNGEGKTNLLESISLFSEFGGLRRAKYDEMINKKYEHWAVVLDTQICSFAMTYNRATGKKVCKIDDNPRRNLSEFSKNYYVLWLTYEMDRLFLQAPSARRDFIDMFCSISSVLHMKNVRNYEKLTKDRLKILKNYVNSSSEKKDINGWLDVLENQIAELGIKIADERTKIAEVLEMNQIRDGFPEFRNKMTGAVEDSILQLDNSSKIECYEKELHDRRERDGFSGMTTFGPNRSDWRVLYAAKSMDASMCSAGEQKMLLNGVFLSFVASRLREDSRHLILMLDDVVAYLDAAHRALLFANIKDFVFRHAERLSIWLSGTSRELFSELGGRVTFFRVHDGIVEEAG